MPNGRTRRLWQRIASAWRKFPREGRVRQKPPQQTRRLAARVKHNGGELHPQHVGLYTDALPDLINGPSRSSPGLAAKRSQPIAGQNVGNIRPHISAAWRVRMHRNPQTQADH